MKGHTHLEDRLCQYQSCRQIEMSPEFGSFLGYFHSCHCSVVRICKNWELFGSLFRVNEKIVLFPEIS